MGLEIVKYIDGLSGRWYIFISPRGVVASRLPCPWALRISALSGRSCLPSNMVGLSLSGTAKDSEKGLTRRFIHFLRVAQALAIASELTLIITKAPLAQYMFKLD